MERYDIVRAKFNPKRTSDLMPEAKNHIGYVGEFMAAWTKSRTRTATPGSSP